MTPPKVKDVKPRFGNKYKNNINYVISVSISSFFRCVRANGMAFFFFLCRVDVMSHDCQFHTVAALRERVSIDPEIYVAFAFEVFSIDDQWMGNGAGAL